MGLRSRRKLRRRAEPTCGPDLVLRKTSRGFTPAAPPCVLSGCVCSMACLCMQVSHSPWAMIHATDVVKPRQGMTLSLTALVGPF